MSLRTPLAEVRGLGSAKAGLHHWWWQRLTAIALVPLTLWLTASLLAVGTAEYAVVLEWARRPLSALLIACFVLALYYHSYLGMQVIIEDYVSSTWQRITCLLALKLLAILPALVCVYALIKLVSGA